MKPFSIILILLLLFLGISCSNTTNPNEKSNINVLDVPKDLLIIDTTYYYKFNYSNQDNNRFGFKEVPNALPIGPCCVYIYDSLIYIIDQYHNNIKIYNIKSEELNVSNKLSENMNLWLQDIILYEENILVTSELDSLYVFDLELKLIERKYLHDNGGRFLSVNDSSIKLFNNIDDKIFILDTLYNVVKVESFEGGVFSRHTKKTVWNDPYIELTSGTIKEETITTKGKTSYWDYQGNRIVLMTLDASQLTISIIFMKPSD